MGKKLYERLRNAKPSLPSPPDGRRTVPVRLCDLDIDVRLNGASHAIAWEPNPEERQAILVAALYPSDDIYWIAA